MKYGVSIFFLWKSGERISFDGIGLPRSGRLTRSAPSETGRRKECEKSRLGSRTNAKCRFENDLINGQTLFRISLDPCERIFIPRNRPEKLICRRGIFRGLRRHCLFHRREFNYFPESISLLQDPPISIDRLRGFRRMPPLSAASMYNTHLHHSVIANC